MTIYKAYFHNNYCQCYHIVSPENKLVEGTCQGNTIIGVCLTHMTCLSCNLMCIAVAMTARLRTLEEDIQCHGLRDGGH